jgi:hypothetical protein
MGKPVEDRRGQQLVVEVSPKSTTFLVEVMTVLALRSCERAIKEDGPTAHSVDNWDLRIYNLLQLTLGSVLKVRQGEVNDQ